MKSIVLEMKERTHDDGTFYRYGVDGKYSLWFVQYDNGNVYSASMAPKKGVHSDLEFYITGKTNDDFYPNMFMVRGPSNQMNTEEIGIYIKELADAQEVLESVKHFFKNSIHAMKYWSERVGEQLANTNLGNYDLDGVEFTKDDWYNIARRIVRGEPLENAMHAYLLEIREVLDAGLDDIEEVL